ncbi:MAG: PspC domain-containing protein [Methanomethylovorans sp.]|uniref:PspC domain-containing protein n=1 Tax=Methanomethylovorans sp. TaxID=2758717 RepID=UPI003530C48D
MYKKLCRSRNERVIAGVCGGIGTYLNVDPTLIRLLWIFLIFLGGGGIPAYFIAWLIIPEEY